jgi:Dolichyl-phosphate-mannose-protein mannosyltransferase
VANEDRVASSASFIRIPASRLLTWLSLLIGAVLRLRVYSTGRSLWFDESLLALNILHRSTAGLFRPLDYYQGAPLGFLFLLKLATKIGGNGEFALRAIPLLAGLISLFLFWRVAELNLSPRAVPLAVALFALSPTLIHFSSEAKQYSSDVAVTLVLLWTATKFADSPLTTSSLLRLSLLGAAAIWFAHPATFILVAIAATLLASALLERNRTLPWQILLAAAVWTASFLLCYFVSLRSLAANQALLNYWRDSFPPHPLASIRFLKWLADAAGKLFDEPAGLVDFLGVALFVAGTLALIRRDRKLAGFLLMPIGITFLASLLGRYPFGGRLLLFLVPILLMVIAGGVVWISARFGRWSPALEIALMIALLFKPLVADVKELLHPNRGEDIKLAIRYIQVHQQPGDVWFIYHLARYQYWYYDELYQLSPATVRIGKDCGTDTACYAADLDQLRGDRRVWILFSHIWIGDGIEEEDMSIQHLDSVGKRLDRFSAHGARAYLYDLSGDPPPAAH